MNLLETTRICGLMGMASFTDNAEQVRSEFRQLRALFERSRTNSALDPAVFTTLSWGMSGDYRAGDQRRKQPGAGG